MKHFSTLACKVLLTSVLPAKQVFGKITLPLGKVEVSIVDDGDQIINRSYHQAKINYFKKRIDRYRDKNPGVPLNELYSEQPSILSSISESQNEIKRMEEVLKNQQYHFPE